MFTRGTTEGINLVAATFASQLAPGDEILLTVAEHYSNLLPWRAVATQRGAAIRVVDIGDDGRLDAARIAVAISPQTRLIALSQCPTCSAWWLQPPRSAPWAGREACRCSSMRRSRRPT